MGSGRIVKAKAPKPHVDRERSREVHSYDDAVRAYFGLAPDVARLNQPARGESECVNGLWHLANAHGRLATVGPRGKVKLTR